ncbi:acyl-CoA N-acyltransferase [Truncatella angustata]|uniref:Acyl-CoA N-acyltransferase n=1 Tax=Truncatella angustata TaxID=152316 RepID=A0A9P8UTZ6_9PEZI|nr:acyl-CoA N-acyltransferase [Truncatella angustata]KAH6658318.1 acyl-CoA N-acyltransferase [Truncatella angustata]KAH8200797.1 hypothetical protein TruAng_005034 [Truncatella angustata]
MAETSPFRIRAATKQDVPAMTQILYRAFGTNQVHAAFWPQHLSHLKVLPGPGDHLVWRGARIEKLLDGSKPWAHCIVAVRQDPVSGEELMVGCAEWLAPEPVPAETDDDGDSSKKPPPESLEERLKKLPAAMDRQAMRDHVAGVKVLEDALGKELGEEAMKDMWWPNSVAVDPDFQGQRIGTLLAQWGIDQADADGKDIYLLASHAGARLYRKLGFVDVFEDEIFGAPQYAMYRPRTARGAEEGSS